ncbi:SlyX family protein [uncultured Pseudoteredinibacter sp.]|uniref:SlyX family protein n=1 Tax=uncultured Pseudoteredinibacter sp. TaxID=1641701 RepID=UPI0026088955|nr:SlyX family protein [uncultured Pseudoteredinibacter sp.]
MSGNEQTALESQAERLAELEARQIYSEDTIAQLNDVVAQQDKEIAALQLQLSHLAKKIDDMQYAVEQGTPGTVTQERPPHY